MRLRPFCAFFVAAILVCAVPVHAQSADAAEQPVGAIEAVVTSPTTFAVCKTLDVATTAHLLATHPGAVEANPLVAGVLHAGGFPALIAISVGLYFLVKQIESPVARGAVNVATCGAAANNLSLMF